MTKVRFGVLAALCLALPMQASAFDFGRWFDRDATSQSSREVRHRSAPVFADMSVTQGRPNTACPSFQVWGLPEVSDPQVGRRGYYTCRAGYAGLYDPAEKTPIWIAEHLSRDTLAGPIQRKGKLFAEDPQIPRAAQGSLADWKKSGLEKGHLGPAGDFTYDETAMSESFLLTNIVPQDPIHNKGIWSNLEGAVRELTSRRGQLYVVTGPVYAGPRTRLFRGQPTAAQGGVSIPDALYKIVVDSARHEMTAFLIPNRHDQGADPARYQVTVRAVEKATGINFNPSLPRAEADRTEVGGGDWNIPKGRTKFRD